MHKTTLIVGLLALGTLFGTAARADIQGSTWFPLGPAPIDNFFGGGVTGRASAIAVNPLNVDELWIGTAAGGVWHSVNGGRNWRPISEREASLAIGAIAVAGCTAAGCARIYAGTGENAIRRDTYYGRGLLVLDNAAESPTWVLRTGTPFSFDLGSINDVVLDPESSGAGKRIFVTLSSGNTSSSSQATVTAPQTGAGGYGIYRSDDDGSTWIKLDVAGAAGARPTDLKMHPSKPSVLYAGFLGVGVFVSEDGGDSWCPLNHGVPLPQGCGAADGLRPDVDDSFDHVGIAIHAADPRVMYVTFGHCPDQLLQSCRPSVFRSADGGKSWALRYSGSTSGAGVNCPTVYSRYTHGLAVDPELPDVLLLGGLKLCRSTDGGATFVASDRNLRPGGSPWGPIIHLDHREIVFHPLDADRVYDTNDGGFAYSFDGGVHWRPGNDDLQITGFYSLTSSPNTPRIIGGSQDNSGQLWRGFRAWEHVGFGDGAYAVIDLDDPLIVYLGSNRGSMLRSTDGGLTFSDFVTPDGPTSSEKAFNAPLVQDPASPHALYYGANRLFRSVTDASSWTLVSPVLATGDADEIAPGQNVITAIGVRDGHVYVGYYGGQVFVSTSACDQASCWTDVSPGPPYAPITDIVVDPNDTNVALLARSGFDAAAHILRTDTSGKQWSAADDGLPVGVPVNALAIEAGPAPVLWAGLDSGTDPDRSNVYRSADGGKTWAPRNGALPNSPVHDLSVDDSRGRVYAGLHGRGAYVLGAANVGTFEGWVDGELRDVPIYGTNFPADRDCTVSLLQQTGDACAASSVDSLGAAIRSDGQGRLVAHNGKFGAQKSVVWACFDGTCLGGTPVAQCHTDANGDGVEDPLTSVVVDCGGTPGVAGIQGAPDLSNPPGSLIDLGFFDGPGRPDGGRGMPVARRGAPSAAAARFSLSAHLQTRSASRMLCAVEVGAPAGRTPAAVLERARSRIDAASACAAAGVVARIDALPPTVGEDLFARDPRLSLAARGMHGAQVVAGVRVKPGDAAAGTCLGVSGLGVAMLSQLRTMRTTFETRREGAGGGRLTFIERTGLGTCAVTLETEKGQSGEDIAREFEALIDAGDRSVAKPYCPERENARSVQRDGASLVSPFATALRVCVQDDAVGFELRPE